MNLKELFDMQRTLDERIIKQHGLEGQDLLDQRILALNVELAELAQETRCFKFWSMNKQPSERVLDELVDVLHFVLSVGISEGHEIIASLENFQGFDFNSPYKKKQNVLDSFLSIFDSSARFLYHRTYPKYSFLLHDFYTLSWKLGFTWEQVTQAYMEKNKENHDRQDRGY